MIVLARTAKHILNLTPFFVNANCVCKIPIIFKVLSVSNSVKGRDFLPKMATMQRYAHKAIAKKKNIGGHGTADGISNRLTSPFTREGG